MNPNLRQMKRSINLVVLSIKVCINCRRDELFVIFTTYGLEKKT